MARISSSVGKKGKNKPADTKSVQQMLNAFAKIAKFQKLKEDSDCGPKTIAAITRFQKACVPSIKADGRVDAGGTTFGVLNAGPKKYQDNAKKDDEKNKGGDKKEPAGKAQVKGPTAGVDKKIIGVLEAVSAHYGKPIIVTSGLRSPTKQGQVMWDYWTTNLRRGDLYKKIKGDKELKKKLNEYYDGGDKAAFVKLIAKDAKAYSRHVWGGAVDIKKNTDPKMVAAISTCLRKLVEKTCIHFDGRGVSVPAKISDKIKEKWK